MKLIDNESEKKSTWKKKYVLFFAEESYSMVSSAVLRAKYIEEEGVYIPV